MQSTTDPKASFVLEHELPLAKQNLTKAFDATFQKSILLLKKRNNALELSPYEHISNLIQAILDKQLDDPLEHFDKYSRILRRHRHNEMKRKVSLRTEDHIDVDSQLAETISKTLHALRRKETELNGPSIRKSSESSVTTANDEHCKRAEDEDAEREVATPDVTLLQYYWQLLGIGFPQPKAFLLSCSIQKLKLDKNLKNARFWGKIFGTQTNYYIVEAQLVDKDLLKRFMAFPKDTQAEADTAFFNENLVPYPPTEIIDSGVELQFPINYPQIPQPKIERPEDDYCFELNRYVYFVSNEFVSNDWTELPSVSQLQIQASRKIVKQLTGNLDAHVNTSPLFPGHERNYLRAVIARISASVHIAPEAAYVMKATELSIDLSDVDVADSDQNNVNRTINIDFHRSNPDYKSKNKTALMDMSAWVHLQPFIFEHGGTKPLVDRKALLIEREKAAEEKLAVEAAAAASMKDTKGAKPDPKATAKAGKAAPVADSVINDNAMTVQASKFKSCQDDLFRDGIAAWTLANTPEIDAMKNIVLAKSNIWLGAYAFACGSICDNIYFGWGTKNRLNDCIDFSMPEFQNDCEDGLVELDDPTPEEEENWLEKKKEESLAELNIEEPNVDIVPVKNDKKRK